MYKTLAIAITIIALSLSVQSQKKVEKIIPGDSRINGEIIEAYTNRWKVSFVNKDGNKTPNKIWTDYGQIIELEGEEYFHRVQDLYHPNMSLEDTWINMMEHKTLIPVSYTSIKPSGLFTHLQFDGNEVTGSTNQTQDGKTQQIASELNENVFDWNMYGMLLVGLPFKTGSQLKLPFYGSQTRDLQWLSVIIVGQETVEQLNKKKVKTWKIETDRQLTFWLTKSAPYVIKLELELQNNNKLLWEVF